MNRHLFHTGQYVAQSNSCNQLDPLWSLLLLAVPIDRLVLSFFHRFFVPFASA